MPRRDNTARLADKYQLTDLEPDVDPEKAAAFLAGGAGKKPQSVPRPINEDETARLPLAKPRVVAQASPRAAAEALPEKAEPWTSRTIRLRQSTALALTKAACSQKMKQAEGKLKSAEPVSVQEIAEHGIRLALAELGYGKY